VPTWLGFEPMLTTSVRERRNNLLAIPLEAIGML